MNRRDLACYITLIASIESAPAFVLFYDVDEAKAERCIKAWFYLCASDLPLSLFRGVQPSAIATEPRGTIFTRGSPASRSS